MILAAVFQGIAQEPDSARQRRHVEKIAGLYLKRVSRLPEQERGPWAAMLDVLETWERALS